MMKNVYDKQFLIRSRGGFGGVGGGKNEGPKQYFDLYIVFIYNMFYMQITTSYLSWVGLEVAFRHYV